MVSGFKIATGSETTTGTWTNASAITAIIYSGAFGIGHTSPNNGSSASIIYPALTLINADSTSWVAGCGGNSTSAAATAPTGMTLETSQATAVMSDTNGTASSFAGGTVTGNTNTAWRSDVIEVTQHASSSKVCTRMLLGVGPC